MMLTANPVILSRNRVMQKNKFYAFGEAGIL
jgi:hypothetical protein